MMRGPIIHGALLAAALLVAYQTWTREAAPEAKRGEFVLWQGTSEAVKAIAYDTENKTVRVERRDGYLWATVTRTTPAAPKPPKPAPAEDAPPAAGDKAPATATEPAQAGDKAPATATEPAQAGDKVAATSGEAPATDEPAPAPTVTEKQFPVGEQGDELFASYAPLRALRELGALTDEQRKEYGLDASKTQLTVYYGNAQRSLAIGDRVYGGSDRYAIDAESGRAYVIAGEVVSPLEGSEAALRERDLLPFTSDQVKTATLATPNQTRELVRGDNEGPHGREAATWAYADAPMDNDQTLANFMTRLEKLVPTEYLPERREDSMTRVVLVTYRGADGAQLGTLALYRAEAAAGAEPEYFLRTENTRVLGQVPAPSAEQIDKDLEQLFAPSK
jgi:hypothetical protein